MTARNRSHHGRNGHRFCPWLCALVLAVTAIAGCAAAPAPSTDDSRSLTEPGAAAAPSDVEPADDTGLDAFQIVPEVASCSSQHGSCISHNLCAANDGVQLPASGCASGTVCCRFSACLNAGDACATVQRCHLNGHTNGLSGCSAGQVCCVFD
jgi:hypothetical protein